MGNGYILGMNGISFRPWEWTRSEHGTYYKFRNKFRNNSRHLLHAGGHLLGI